MSLPGFAFITNRFRLKGGDRMRIQLLKRMVFILATVLAVQGCAIFVSDQDDFPHHREHGRHEHSSLQTTPSDERADDGKQMTANQNRLGAEHQKG